MPPVRVLLPILLGLMLFTALEYRTLEIIHSADNSSNAEAAMGVLTGHARLKVWQNRLLGPTMVGTLADVSGYSFARSHRIFALTFLALTNLICFFLFRKASGSEKTAWAFTLAGVLLFLVLQHHSYLFIWDYIDLCVMSLFAWAIFTGAPLWFLVLLFYAELLNREAALFIALWICLDAIILSWRGHQSKAVINGKKFLLGACLMLVGLAWTHFTRKNFLVRQTMPVSSSHDYIGDQFWMLPNNLMSLTNSRPLDVLVPLALIGTTLFLLLRAWSTLGERGWKIGALLGAFVSTNLMFGILLEMRIWLILIPFLLWLMFHISHNTQSTSLALFAREGSGK